MLCNLISLVLLVSFATFAQAKPAKFRIAVMYSDPRSLDIKCAIDTFKKQITKNTPGIDIDLFSYGDDPTTLTASAAKIADSGYDAATGPMLSHEVLMVGPTFSQAHIPLFLPIASNPELTKKFPNTIRMVSSSDHYAQLAAANAVRSPKNKSILVVTNQSLPYSRDYTQEFMKQLRLRQFKGQLTQYKYLLGKADFSKIAKLAADTKADLIYAPVYSEDVSALYLSLSDAKLSTKVFTHAGLFDAQATILAHYDPNVLIQFNGLWDQQTRTPEDEQFLKAIRTRCDTSQIKPWTMGVWDAVNLAIAAHNTDPKARGQAFVQIVHNINFIGILGKWTLDSQREPIRPLPVFSLSPKGTKLETIIPVSEIRQSSEVQP